MLLLSGFHFFRFIPPVYHSLSFLPFTFTTGLISRLVLQKDLFMTGRHQKNLPHPLGTYSNELSVSLLKIHGLFLILIHLA